MLPRRIVLSVGLAAIAIFAIRHLLSGGLYLFPPPTPLSEPVASESAPPPDVSSDSEEASRDRTTATFRNGPSQNHFPTLEIGPIPSLPARYPAESQQHGDRLTELPPDTSKVSTVERPENTEQWDAVPAITEPPLIPIPPPNGR
ncbi:MAG: hypothetical protein D6741_08370 [Planctomycetota bacterium]|nr:MAG: hypothetical protein D6741_08370 [Planctomycetota bacterium]